jgi:threonine/homoserine/homoserine lactone efflux protein
MINFLKGIIAGAVIAFPVGPIGIICLRRTLSQGPIMGLSSGLGSATADIIYSSIALAGLGFIYTFLVEHTILVRVICSIFLCAFGLKIAFSKPSRPVATWSRDILQAYFSTFFLTLANPLLTLSFITVFAAFDIKYNPEIPISFVSPILGVFLGSSLWWFVIGGVTQFFNFTILPETTQRINQISGIAIILSGISTLVTILFR